MTVQHSPAEKKATEPAATFEWKTLIEGQEIIVTVNENQNQYLNLPETTPNDKVEFLKRIWEEQQKNAREAEATAANQQDKQTPPGSPTPTEQSLEIIKSRNEESKSETQKEENDADKAQEDNEKACGDRHHLFEQRTKTDLAPIGKKFIKVCSALMLQLDRSKYPDEVSRQFGDDLLNDCRAVYEKLEEVREFCLEPLRKYERTQYSQYLIDKFNLLQTCERIHRSYFERQEENKQRRQEESQQTQQPPQMSTPFHQPPPQFIPPQGQPGPQYAPPPGQSGAQFVPPQTNFSHQHQQQNPPPGFHIYEEDSRVPTPSVINYHTRFKLKEELSLVEKFDATQPRAYMAFRAQWTNFHNKMEMEHRSSLDLYYALLQVLGGSAKDLVQTKYPSEQSYAQAIKKLDNLFFNPANLLRDMVQNLFKGVKMVDNYESLLSGLNNLWDAWNDLDQADLTKEQLKGLLFIAATEKNLSEESWKCWLETQNLPKFKQNPMAAFEISAYMGAINTAMLNAQKRQNAIGTKERHPNTPPKTNKSNKKQSTIYGTYNIQGQSKDKSQQQARGPNDSCYFCGEAPHRYQLSCPKLKTMSPAQIYAAMTSAGIECQMCLGLGHRTRACPPVQEGLLKKCNIKDAQGVECQRYHCRVLHKKKPDETKATTSNKQE